MAAFAAPQKQPRLRRWQVAAVHTPASVGAAHGMQQVNEHTLQTSTRQPGGGGVDALLPLRTHRSIHASPCLPATNQLSIQSMGAASSWPPPTPLELAAQLDGLPMQPDLQPSAWEPPSGSRVQSGESGLRQQDAASGLQAWGSDYLQGSFHSHARELPANFRKRKLMNWLHDSCTFGNVQNAVSKYGKAVGVISQVEEQPDLQVRCPT